VGVAYGLMVDGVPLVHIKGLAQLIGLDPAGQLQLLRAMGSVVIPVLLARDARGRAQVEWFLRVEDLSFWIIRTNPNKVRLAISARLVESKFPTNGAHSASQGAVPGRSAHGGYPRCPGGSTFVDCLPPAP
jgi:hypothetical protein